MRQGPCACAVNNLSAASTAMPKLTSMSGIQQLPMHPHCREHRSTCLQANAGAPQLREAMHSSCSYAFCMKSATLSAGLPCRATSGSCVWLLTDVAHTLCPQQLHPACSPTPLRCKRAKQSGRRQPPSWSGAWLQWKPCWPPVARSWPSRPSQRPHAAPAQTSDSG